MLYQLDEQVIVVIVPVTVCRVVVYIVAFFNCKQVTSQSSSSPSPAPEYISFVCKVRIRRMLKDIPYTVEVVVHYLLRGLLGY